jgi:serine/threonine protein phosphatase 1
MLGRWFRSPAAARPGSIPDGRAVYAIGDVHGRLDLLDDLLRRIAEDAARHSSDTVRELVMLGDYIDRGPASRGVVDRLLLDPLPGFLTVRLMGNHEDALLGFLDGLSDGLDWLAYGGLETLMSYEVPLRSLPSTLAASTELRRGLSQALPKSHLEFFRNCTLHHTVGDYVFVHAGVRPGAPLEKQSPNDLMWIRDDFLRSRVPLPNFVVVHGHTIVDQPQDRTHRINVDTGAFVSGRLTCLVLRGNERRFITTLDD